MTAGCRRREAPIRDLGRPARPDADHHHHDDDDDDDDVTATCRSGRVAGQQR